ncbi:MAG: HAD family hydrolase [Oscillospiraceae bacterium]|jgi:HAD superfamily hydrolase (TIGR01509 family)|nr:HAD family hydrolase [Oscillospiraceae bacterium]
MIDWIFFDLGSTLLDETDRVNERISETAKRLKIDETMFRTQLEITAKTHPYVIHMELPNGAEWAPWPKRLDQLYLAAIPTLDLLHKKYRLGVIANHGKDTAQLLGINRFFSTYMVSAAAGFGKPDLRIFKMALEQAGCAPKNAWMIGDRLDNDIYPAKKLGMKTIWIRQGFGGITEPMSADYEADYAVNTLPEILGILGG